MNRREVTTIGRRKFIGLLSSIFGWVAMRRLHGSEPDLTFRNFDPATKPIVIDVKHIVIGQWADWPTNEVVKDVLA
jgi:hypothetical protein